MSKSGKKGKFKGNVKNNDNNKNDSNNNKNTKKNLDEKQNKELKNLDNSEIGRVDNNKDFDNKPDTVKKDDTQKDDNKLSSKDIFDIREKRIGFVFKIIYVFAAIFIAAFLEFAKEPSKENVSLYAILAVTVSASSIMLITMCIYIFHEMKCFKINTIKSEPNSSTEFQEAEDSYEGLFVNLSCVIITGIIIILVSLESNTKFSNEELSQKINNVFYVSTILLLIDWIVILFYKNSSQLLLRKMFRGLAIVIAMIAVTSCLMTAKLQKYRTDNSKNDTQMEQNDQTVDETITNNNE